jgi:hypothetical protein
MLAKCSQVLYLVAARVRLCLERGMNHRRSLVNKIILSNYHVLQMARLVLEGGTRAEGGPFLSLSSLSPLITPLFEEISHT